MLKVIKNMHQLDYPALTEVYKRSLQLDGENNYRNCSGYEQLRRAEADFYEYISGTFFPCKENFLLVFEHHGIYVSALRLEAYRDGFLLTGLETKPDECRKGFAKALLQEAISFTRQHGRKHVYSHVEKKNKASLSVHRAAGFEVSEDFAVYLDGTITTNACTLCFKT